MLGPPPTTDDPGRDARIRELASLNEQLQTAAAGLVGPLLLPQELTMQQLRVLNLVAQEPGLSGQDLGSRLHVSAPTASGLIDRLADKGLLERTDDATDRRVRRVHLTEEGIRTVRSVGSILDRLLLRIVGQVSIEELDVILSGTKAMLAAVRRAVEREPGGPPGNRERPQRRDGE